MWFERRRAVSLGRMLIVTQNATTTQVRAPGGSNLLSNAYISFLFVLNNIFTKVVSFNVLFLFFSSLFLGDDLEIMGDQR